MLRTPSFVPSLIPIKLLKSSTPRKGILAKTRSQAMCTEVNAARSRLLLAEAKLALSPEAARDALLFAGIC